MNKYANQIRLKIKGPFLTASGNVETYGYAKAFIRNALGDPVIPESHIKGKLRMALEELSLLIASPKIDIGNLFGSPSGEQSYEPKPGILKFSSFVLETEQYPNTRTRTAIDETTSTAGNQQLRMVEDLFASNAVSTWFGTIEYYTENEKKALQVTKRLSLGFKWLTNLGAEKGVGFGRLYQVEICKPVEILPAEAIQSLSIEQEDTRLHLSIKLLQPLTIGGIKTRKANYVRSERIITGAAIKGALAVGLNKAYNIKPLYSPLLQKNAASYLEFSELVSYFEKIRVTHAFPSYEPKIRPVKVPISQVDYHGEKFDVALSGKYPLIKGKSPAYFADWKNGEEYFGSATPVEVFKTRSAIDDKTRRSQDGQLFTYSAITSKDKRGKDIYWVSEVDFSFLKDHKQRQKVMTQFVDAVQKYLDRIGKQGSKIEVQVYRGEAERAIKSKKDDADVLLVSLQTETIMLNPADCRNQRDANLFGLYKKYWNEVSSMDSLPSLELLDFFADQSFKGGYLYHRYLGRFEREQNPDQYYPFLITNPGSVFVLRKKNISVAQDKLKLWRESGLPLPKWALNKYEEFSEPLWKVCPFVPQNGFGEICANLITYWELMPNIETQSWEDGDG